MAYKIKCDTCLKDFESRQPNTKSCSRECSRLRNNKIKGILPELGLSNGTVGAVSEMLVSVDLIIKGYATFRALSPNCVCDLIATKKDKFLRIEVKTGYITIYGRLQYPNAESNKFDILAVYVRSENKVHYLDNSFRDISL